MDQMNYYSLPKDGYLDVETRADAYAMGASSLDTGAMNMNLHLNMGLMTTDDLATSYANEENSPKNGTKSSLYKTELCKRFSEFGSCRYGAKCQFAHGIAELRHVVRHPKYKTTKCKSYWGSGHCPYGSRCRFIHEETESLSQQPQYSPSPPPNGLYMQEKSPSPYSSLSASASSVSGLASSGGYLYEVEGNGNMSPFQKEYAPLPPFEKSASAPWGIGGPSRSQARMSMSYGGETYARTKQPVMHHSLGGGVMTPPAATADESSASSYPDLQDAIDALVKFSISPSGTPEPKTRPSSLESINTPPLEALGSTTASTTTASAQTSSSDFSLEGDDMWKHFPTLSDTSADFAENDWPAGVSLSLEATGLFGSDDKEASPAATTPKDKKDEASPRLSVFERFH